MAKIQTLETGVTAINRYAPGICGQIGIPARPSGVIGVTGIDTFVSVEDLSPIKQKEYIDKELVTIENSVFLHQEHETLDNIYVNSPNIDIYNQCNSKNVFQSESGITLDEDTESKFIYKLPNGKYGILKYTYVNNPVYNKIVDNKVEESVTENHLSPDVLLMGKKSYFLEDENLSIIRLERQLQSSSIYSYNFYNPLTNSYSNHRYLGPVIQSKGISKYGNNIPKFKDIIEYKIEETSYNEITYIGNVVYGELTTQEPGYVEIPIETAIRLINVDTEENYKINVYTYVNNSYKLLEPLSQDSIIGTYFAYIYENNTYTYYGEESKFFSYNKKETRTAYWTIIDDNDNNIQRVVPFDSLYNLHYKKDYPGLENTNSLFLLHEQTSYGLLDGIYNNTDKTFDVIGYNGTFTDNKPNRDTFVTLDLIKTFSYNTTKFPDNSLRYSTSEIGYDLDGNFAGYNENDKLAYSYATVWFIFSYIENDENFREVKRYSNSYTHEIYDKVTEKYVTKLCDNVEITIQDRNGKELNLTYSLFNTSKNKTSYLSNETKTLYNTYIIDLSYKGASLSEYNAKKDTLKFEEYQFPVLSTVLKTNKKFKDDIPAYEYVSQEILETQMMLSTYWIYNSILDEYILFEESDKTNIIYFDGDFYGVTSNKFITETPYDENNVKKQYDLRNFCNFSIETVTKRSQFDTTKNQNGFAPAASNNITVDRHIPFYLSNAVDKKPINEFILNSHKYSYVIKEDKIPNYELSYAYIYVREAYVPTEPGQGAYILNQEGAYVNATGSDDSYIQLDNFYLEVNSSLTAATYIKDVKYVEDDNGTYKQVFTYTPCKEQPNLNDTSNNSTNYYAYATAGTYYLSGISTDSNIGGENFYIGFYAEEDDIYYPALTGNGEYSYTDTGIYYIDNNGAYCKTTDATYVKIKQENIADYQGVKYAFAGQGTYYYVGNGNGKYNSDGTANETGDYSYAEQDIYYVYLEKQPDESQTGGDTSPEEDTSNDETTQVSETYTIELYGFVAANTYYEHKYFVVQSGDSKFSYAQPNSYYKAGKEGYFHKKSDNLQYVMYKISDVINSDIKEKFFDNFGTEFAFYDGKYILFAWSKNGTYYNIKTANTVFNTVNTNENYYPTKLTNTFDRQQINLINHLFKYKYNPDNSNSEEKFTIYTYGATGYEKLTESGWQGKKYNYVVSYVKESSENTSEGEYEYYSSYYVQWKNISEEERPLYENYVKYNYENGSYIQVGGNYKKITDGAYIQIEYDGLGTHRPVENKFEQRNIETYVFVNTDFIRVQPPTHYKTAENTYEPIGHEFDQLCYNGFGESSNYYYIYNSLTDSYVEAERGTHFSKDGKEFIDLTNEETGYGGAYLGNYKRRENNNITHTKQLIGTHIFLNNTIRETKPGEFGTYIKCHLEDNEKCITIGDEKYIPIELGTYLYGKSNNKWTYWENKTGKYVFDDLTGLYKEAKYGEVATHNIKYDANGNITYSNVANYRLEPIIVQDEYWEQKYEEIEKPFLINSSTTLTHPVTVSSANILSGTKETIISYAIHPRLTYKDYIITYNKTIEFGYYDSQNLFRKYTDRTYVINDITYGLVQVPGDIVNNVPAHQELKPLHKYTTVSREQVLSDLVYQEEYSEPISVLHESSWGMINGEKLVIDEEIFVPDSYVDVKTVNPITGEYEVRKEVAIAGHTSYKYHFETVPFVTTSYIYQKDAITVNQLNELVNSISENGSSLTLVTNSVASNVSALNSSISGATASIAKAISDSFVGDILSSELTQTRSLTSNVFNNLISSITQVASQTVDTIDESIDIVGKNIINAANGIVQNNASLQDVLINSNEVNTSNIINSLKKQLGNINASINNLASAMASSQSSLNNVLSELASQPDTNNTTYINVEPDENGNIPHINLGGNGSSNGEKIKNYNSVKEIGKIEEKLVEVEKTKSVSLPGAKLPLRKTSTVLEKQKVIDLYDTPRVPKISYVDTKNETMHAMTSQIGLHKKVSKQNLAYNGKVYELEYTTYEGIADILSELSRRIPTKQEFIIDVAKQLYINTAFDIESSYKAPADHAKTAIQRALVMWTELENNKYVKPTEKDNTLAYSLIEAYK